VIDLDNITHGLLGAAIGMLRRRDGGPEHDAPVTDTDKAVVWATFLAAELPDIDVFFATDPMGSLVWHRGITHAVLIGPVAALLPALAVKAVWRKARLGTVYGWSLLSLGAAHLFSDWLTGWGTRLLLPFSEARLGLDWVPIVDWLALLVLAAGVWMARRRPLLRHRLMVGVLSFLLVYWVGYRGGAHTFVERAVWQQVNPYEVAQLRVAPNLFNPLHWEYTVDFGDRYEQGTAWAWGLREAVTVTPKPPEDEVIRAVRAAPELKPFFDHFGYPLITYNAVPDGYEVTLSDIRYQAAGRGMTYTVALAPDLSVVSVGE
jgi:inner membrane protein